MCYWLSKCLLIKLYIVNNSFHSTLFGWLLQSASEEKEEEPSETDANERHNDDQKEHKTHPNLRRDRDRSRLAGQQVCIELHTGERRVWLNGECGEWHT